MSRSEEAMPAELAARAITVGILANTAFKVMLSLALGGPGFRRAAAGGLIALGSVIGLTLWLL
jgi:hypothetical protein